MGADTLAWFDLDGQRLSARMEPARRRALDTHVGLTLDLAHASFFSAASGRRL